MFHESSGNMTAIHHSDDANQLGGNGPNQQPVMDTMTPAKDLTFAYAAGAEEWFKLIRTDEGVLMRDTTSLTLVINGTTWTDWEDDLWSLALHAFRPHSLCLEHLTLIIEGNTLFTTLTHVKPNLTTTIPPMDHKPRVPYMSLNPLHDSSSSDSETGNPRKRKLTRRRPPPDALPKKHSPKKRYHSKRIPAATVVPHPYPKHFISRLLALPVPIRRITLHGPLELRLRVRILDTLYPAWKADAYCASQGGLAPEHVAAVAKAWDHEVRTVGRGEGMIEVGSEEKVQDEEDFGSVNRKDSVQDAGDADEMVVSGARGNEVAPRTFGMADGWIVPTGKAGRAVVGWSAKKAWCGPL